MGGIGARHPKPVLTWMERVASTAIAGRSEAVGHGIGEVVQVAGQDVDHHHRPAFASFDPVQTTAGHLGETAFRRQRGGRLAGDHVAEPPGDEEADHETRQNKPENAKEMVSMM